MSRDLKLEMSTVQNNGGSGSGFRGARSGDCSGGNSLDSGRGGRGGGVVGRGGGGGVRGGEGGGRGVGGGGRGGGVGGRGGGGGGRGGGGGVRGGGGVGGRGGGGVGGRGGGGVGGRGGGGVGGRGGGGVGGRGGGGVGGRGGGGVGGRGGGGVGGRGGGGVGGRGGGGGGRGGWGCGRGGWGKSDDNKEKGYGGYRSSGGGGGADYENGSGNGKRGASRGGRKRYPITPKLDMTPVGNIATYNVYWEESEKLRKAKELERVAAPPRPPFVYEPHETDFYLEASELLQELMKERAENSLKDCRGNTIGLCGHCHEEVCRFCDGRRGPWVRPGVKPTPAFLRYQNAIIGTKPCTSSSLRLLNTDLETGAPRGSPNKPTVTKTVTEEMPLFGDDKITDIL